MGKLYVVPTPVGNLEDMTFRAIRILKEADLVLAEATCSTGVITKVSSNSLVSASNRSCI
jgi:16S rRNA (cytidine1402-2'-O)-methyltransferase